jgi:hypothetical protein
MNYGIFMRANYQDGLKVGNITDGVVGSWLIKDVPNGYSVEDLETLMILQGQGFQFGDRLHELVILPEEDWPSTCRFQYDVTFNGCVRGMIQQLTKQRLVRVQK